MGLFKKLVESIRALVTLPAQFNQLRADILTHIDQQNQRRDAEVRQADETRHASLAGQVGVLARHIDRLKLEQGRLQAELHRRLTTTNIQDYEFQVFSQWGEDGILQYLTRVVDVPDKTFIEFGVEDFSESNCRFLMIKDNWRGFVLDGSEENIARLRSSEEYWQNDLEARAAFITRENIDDLLAERGFDEDLGILSIDLDGVDYWILEAIDAFRPRIMVLEYNAVLGKDRAISVPYEDCFVRTRAHHSNLYFGASLAALAHLAEARGYALVGTNSAGVNAFFVRRDLLGERLRPLSVEQAFTSSSHRESRDAEGRLTYLSGPARAKLIAGLPVVNVVTGQTETL